MKKSTKKAKKETKKPSSPKKDQVIEKKLAEIGIKIRTTRTKRGLSVLELAELCGIAAPQIYKIERGSNCTVKTLLKVRKALRITITL